MSKGVELESSNKYFYYKFITFYKHILRMPYFKSRLRGKIQISLTSQFLRFISSQQKICSYFSSGSNDTYFAFKLLTLIHQLNGVNGEIQMELFKLPPTQVIHQKWIQRMEKGQWISNTSLRKA